MRPRAGGGSALQPGRAASPATWRTVGGALLLAVISVSAIPAFAAAQASPPSPGRTPSAARTDAASAGCDLCHGELELLRQHQPTLPEARRLLVPLRVLRGSAHDTMSCGSCHTGFDRWPHPEPTATGTDSCISCHEDIAGLWRGSIHEREDEQADCMACHGVHDVAPAEALQQGGAAVAVMNGTCVGCHETAALPPTDPHQDSIACASCHSAHATELVESAGSTVAPLTQYETCGACHEEVVDSARDDAHGRALTEAGTADLAQLRHDAPDAPPTCTSCHGAHGMLAPSHARFDQDMVEECAACHADHARTYFGTYHGKATAVGSEIVATCDHCHGAHQILPQENAASMVAPDNLVETCASCHEYARPAFVEYDSHPDPMDRERSAPLFYSFVFMNSILFGVLGVFTLHTALWWVRLMIDRRKGVVHGPGGAHE